MMYKHLFMDWESVYKGIKECDNLDLLDEYPPRFLGGYYISYYICPDCNKLLYKIQARGVTTSFKEYKNLNVFNIFTCPSCNRFFVSLVNNSGSAKLSDLALVSKKYSDYEQYTQKLLDTVNCVK